MQSGQESFSWSKFWDAFKLNNGVLWIKDIVSIFNFRKLIIYVLILGTVLGFGYYKGYQNRPIKVALQYGKEAIIKLQNQQLHIDKDGNVYLEDLKGKVIKQISVKDMSNLKAQLMPYGFQMKVIGVAGIGIGQKDKTPQGEVGVGMSWFRAWKAQLDLFATNLGVYQGISYNITDNAGLGIGAGTGYQFNDGRVIIYGRIRF
jgi:hypothetical protein